MYICELDSDSGVSHTALLLGKRVGVVSGQNGTWKATIRGTLIP